MDTYNHRVFLIENEDERDQCQFVYTPVGDEKPKRCERDGMYRIGLTIFLCGIHMPGIGRHKEVKAKAVKKDTVHDRLFALLSANAGEIVSYEDIESKFPVFEVRGNLHVAISQLRRKKDCNIVSVQGLGYKYIEDK